MIDRKNSHFTANSVEFSVPCVRDLTQPVKPVTLETPVLDVLGLFQEHADLSALPVMDEFNNYFGIISRRNYLSLLTRAFARELFARKPLESLLDGHADIFVAPLITHADDRIDKVIFDFLNCDPGLKYEALPVLGEDGIMGVVKIADMMLKISQSQGSLIETMQRLSVRLNDEVANAASLQKNLLRPSLVALPGVQGVTTMITASEIGGDFYDYYIVDGRWVVILVGDVSGHGIAAGTIVCAAKAGVNVMESEKEKEPHKILARLSNIIFNTAHQALLMTMFAIVLDTRTGELKYANAGHQFAYLYRAVMGQLESLELGGLPLGKNAKTEYEQAATEIDLGDRLFLYTDSIVEEENDLGECFGYERLEELLNQHGESDIASLNEAVLKGLTNFLGRDTFNDDVTIFCVEHFEKTIDQSAIPIVELVADDIDQTHIVEASYRAKPAPISPKVNRQELIFLAEHNFSDLIPELAQQGLRRILLQDHAINQQLGWGNLLNQHQHKTRDDLAILLRNPEQRREFYFTHSEDKDFIIAEVDAWLQEQDLGNADRMDAVIFLLDELIENGLCGAPRDGKGRPLYAKGTSRELEADEVLRLDVSIQNGLLGISMIDSWGTLAPNVFLNRLSRHVRGMGLDAGIGGGGFYLIWRMADYLQLRVFPNQQTQVCAFVDFKQAFDPESDKGFQFLFHSELYEAVNND
jgi:serine phosphatase RsbU (regulator of sigma subunit)